jgi:hypothetical protein
MAKHLVQITFPGGNVKILKNETMHIIVYLCIYFVAKVEMQTQCRKLVGNIKKLKCMCTSRQNSWACVF